MKRLIAILTLSIACTIPFFFPRPTDADAAPNIIYKFMFYPETGPCMGTMWLTPPDPGQNSFPIPPTGTQLFNGDSLETNSNPSCCVDYPDMVGYIVTSSTTDGGNTWQVLNSSPVYNPGGTCDVERTYVINGGSIASSLPCILQTCTPQPQK